MNTEQWRSVIDYEGIYEVSNQGRVRSVDRIVNGRKIDAIYLKIDKYRRFGSKRSDYRVFLNKNGKQSTHFVSRLVATAFIGDKRHLQVNHIDCNPLNNFVYNLEWVTPKENMQHAIKNGLVKLTNKPILATRGNTKYYFSSLSEASRTLKIDIASISLVLNGLKGRKTAGGYKFTFKQKNRRSG